MAKRYTGGATQKNTAWKISGGKGGRTGSANFGSTSAFSGGVAPLKGSAGGKQSSGRKLKG